MGRMDHKVVLITGIGGGMGREAALRFAAEGAKVVGCDLVAEGAEETVRLVREAGGEITNFAPVNLANAVESQKWIDAAALQKLAAPLAKNGYGQYLLGLLK